jgi:small GTP-binding protein
MPFPNPEISREQSVKVVLLEDSGVGKSSLALRFVTVEFRPYSESTIGASFMSKSIRVPLSPSVQYNEGQKTVPKYSESKQYQCNIGLKIGDTAGQEKYHSLAPMYYRGAEAAILVYDVTVPASFVALQDWVFELKQNASPELMLVICGNKSDLG